LSFNSKPIEIKAAEEESSNLLCSKEVTKTQPSYSTVKNNMWKIFLTYGE